MRQIDAGTNPRCFLFHGLGNTPASMEVVPHEDEMPKTLGFQWLLRLRWMAIAAQVLTCLIVVVVLRIPLPIAILAPCIAFTALTNLLLCLKPVSIRGKSTGVGGNYLSRFVRAHPDAVFHRGSPQSLHHALSVAHCPGGHFIAELGGLDSGDLLCPVFCRPLHLRTSIDQ